MIRVYPLVLAAFGFVSSAAYAGENIPFDSLPAPVKATALREIKGGQVLDVEKDTKRGNQIFEIEFIDGGVKWELDIAMDGTLLSRRED